MYGARKSRKARWTKPKQQKIRQLRLRPRGKWKATTGTAATSTTGTAVGGSGSAGAEAVGLGVGIVAPSGLCQALTQGRYSSVVIVAARTPRTKRTERGCRIASDIRIARKGQTSRAIQRFCVSQAAHAVAGQNCGWSGPEPRSSQLRVRVLRTHIVDAIPFICFTST